MFIHSPLEKNNKTDTCLNCRWFPVCVGGCPLINKKINHYPFSKSPLHDFYQFIIPRYIRFCGNKMLQQAVRKGIRDFDILDAQ
jgi:sulfatase maturation enzyme AslB (radical SAM superfamily)